jgi:hypothetical protein
MKQYITPIKTSQMTRFYNFVTLEASSLIQQDRQCTHIVTLKCVCITTVAVEKN